MRILGIDPGIGRTGWGAIKVESGKLKVENGKLRMESGELRVEKMMKSIHK